MGIGRLLHVVLSCMYSPPLGMGIGRLLCVVLSCMHCNAEFYCVGKIQHTGIGHGYWAIGRPPQQRRVVSRRRNTFVGGKCALPSALLVSAVMLNGIKYVNSVRCLPRWHCW